MINEKVSTEDIQTLKELKEYINELYEWIKEIYDGERNMTGKVTKKEKTIDVSKPAEDTGRVIKKATDEPLPESDSSDEEPEIINDEEEQQIDEPNESDDRKPWEM